MQDGDSGPLKDASSDDLRVRALLESATFRRSSQLRSLLRYLWEHRGDSASEYAIAVEALGRRPDFDPQTDSSVRVSVLRLREKIETYYRTEGKNEPERLVIPDGSHQPRFERLPDVSGPRGVRRGWWMAWLTSAILLGSVAALWVENRRLRSFEEVATVRRALDPFWRTVLSGDRPVRIVIPDPLFVRLGGSSLRVRDVTVNEFERLGSSPHIGDLIRRFGPPAPSANYAVMADALGAARLLRHLCERQRPADVVAERALPLRGFADAHLVFLGIPHTSRYLSRFGANWNFVPGGDSRRILNRAPREMEPKVFDTRELSRTERTEPTLLKVLPGSVPESRIVLLGGDTKALADYLTSPPGLRAARALLDGKPFFEAVVEVRLHSEVVVGGRVAAVREIPASY